MTRTCFLGENGITLLRFPTIATQGVKQDDWALNRSMRRILIISSQYGKSHTRKTCLSSPGKNKQNERYLKQKNTFCDWTCANDICHLLPRWCGDCDTQVTGCQNFIYKQKMEDFLNRISTTSRDLVNFWIPHTGMILKVMWCVTSWKKNSSLDLETAKAVVEHLQSEKGGLQSLHPGKLTWNPNMEVWKLEDDVSFKVGGFWKCQPLIFPKIRQLDPPPWGRSGVINSLTSSLCFGCCRIS